MVSNSYLWAGSSRSLMISSNGATFLLIGWWPASLHAFLVGFHLVGLGTMDRNACEIKVVILWRASLGGPRANILQVETHVAAAQVSRVCLCLLYQVHRPPFTLESTITLGIAKLWISTNLTETHNRLT